ncbi:MAG: hypothetical protein V1874_02835 [Spirochaetota bacterium]
MKIFSRFFLASLLLALFLVSVSNPASAGYARMEGMGVEGDSYWAIQKDETYIFYNPAYLSKFTPQIYAASNSGSGTSTAGDTMGGLILSPANNFNLYFTSGRPIGYLTYPYESTFATRYGFLNDTNTRAPLHNEQGNLTASFDMGRSAFGFNTSYSATKDNDATNQYARSVLNTNFGFLMEFSQGMSMDASLGVTRWHIDQTQSHDTVYAADTYDFDAMVRFNMAISEISRLHIFGIAEKLDRSETENHVEATDKYRIIRLGISDEMNITKTSLVYAMALIGYQRESLPGGPTKNRDVKVGAGVETNVFECLSARFGFNRMWYQYQKTSSQNDKSLEDQDGATFSFGLGLRLGNVVLDWKIAKALLADGPYFISGNGGNYSTWFEARYNFETTTAKR